MEIYVVSVPFYVDEYYLTSESAVKRFLYVLNRDGFIINDELKERMLATLKEKGSARLGGAIVIKQKAYN